MTTENAITALTGDDLAVAEQGLAHLIEWWRAQPGRSKFKRDQIAAARLLRSKLAFLRSLAYPYKSGAMEIGAPDFGAEPLMRPDRRAFRKAQRAAAKVNRLLP